MTTVDSFDDKRIRFFMEELCSRSDDVYRLCYAFTQDLDYAQDCLTDAFQLMADNLEVIMKADDFTTVVVSASWQAFCNRGLPHQSDGEHIPWFGGLNLKERVSVTVVDYLGMAVDPAAVALGISADELRETVALARKKMIAQGKKIPTKAGK